MRSLPFSVTIESGLRLALSQKGRFILVGAWNTVVGYGLFVLIHLVFGAAIGPLWTLIVSYCFALPHSFVTQRFLVFRQTGSWRLQLARFALSSSVLFASNLVFLPLAIHATGGNPIVIQAAFVVLLVIASYLTHKHYSFASRP